MTDEAPSFEQKYDDLQSALASAARFSEEDLPELRLDFARFCRTYASQFPVFSWEEFLSLEAKEMSEEDEDLAEEHLELTKAACEEYFADRFVEPIIEDGKILCICGATLAGGNLIDSMMGSFKWGLAHGQGHCTRCHQSVRMLHYICDEDFDPDRPLLDFSFPLIYHPSGIIIPGEEPGEPESKIIKP